MRNQQRSENDVLVVEFLSAFAEELEYQFVSPFSLICEDGTVHEYLGHIKDFGSPAGLIFGGSHSDSCIDCEEQYALTYLAAFAIENVDAVKELLTDWGWQGLPTQKPNWTIAAE